MPRYANTWIKKTKQKKTKTKTKQNNNNNNNNKPLSYFIIPNITVVWHIYQVETCSKHDRSNVSFGDSSYLLKKQL